jgi:hypothetical protein
MHHSFWTISISMLLSTGAAIISLPFERATMSANEYPGREDIGNPIGSQKVVDLSAQWMLVNEYRRVSVIDTKSKRIIRTFQPEKKGDFFRKAFLLDQGKPIAALQGYQAIFWDVETGKEKGHVNQWVYGFSSDEKRFFTQTKDGIFLYAYPQLTQVCNLVKKPTTKVMDFYQFSPDNQFLAILVSSILPATDPVNQKRLRMIVSTSVGDYTYVRLFNLQNCQEIEEISPYEVYNGEFSLDSKYYKINGMFRPPNFQKGKWIFDLKTHKFQEVSE